MLLNTVAKDEIVSRVKGDAKNLMSMLSLPSQTVVSRSEMVLEKDDVSYDRKLKTFLVKGSITTRAVKRFPKESCTCPSMSACYHVLAAERFIGMHEPVLKKLANITKLRKNGKKSWVGKVSVHIYISEMHACIVWCFI